MAKFETNLSAKDKVTIAIVLFVGVMFAFVWYAIKPAITSINSIGEDIDQAKITEAQYRGKIMNLTSAETIFGSVTGDLYDSTDDYYEVMTSSQIDRMMTNYVLSFGLFPEDLTISMPLGPVDEVPYVYSEAALRRSASSVEATPTPTPIEVNTGLSSSSDSGTSAAENNTANVANASIVESLIVPYGQARDAAGSTSSSGVQAANLTLVMSGDEASCQALIDDLCTNPSVRITGFNWLEEDMVEQINEETGSRDLVGSGIIRLQVNLRLYMTNVTDYEEAVSAAVEAAGAEG